MLSISNNSVVVIDVFNPFQSVQENYSFEVAELKDKKIDFVVDVCWSFKDDIHLFFVSQDSDLAYIYNGISFERYDSLEIGKSCQFVFEIEQGKLWFFKKDQKIQECNYIF